MKKIFFLQCILCSFLLFFGVTIIFRSNHAASQAGTFGIVEIKNDTLEDLINRFFKELFDEKR